MPIPAKAPQALTEANSRQFDPDAPPPEQVVPGLGGSAFATELRGIVDRSFCYSQKFGDQQGRADRQMAEPAILEFERKLVKRAFKLGIPLFAHCVQRGAQDQNRLFVQGRSKAKAGESPHNFGAAVDLIHGTKGWDLTRKQWEIIGHLGKELAKSLSLKIEWGGDWKFYDPAHWELKNWRDIRARYLIAQD